ncbi:MAG: hypothetical protein HXY21_03835, partial [Parvularculaceae bacterium]|nr:hypothetical protein [Parvularculaceae bacterium]
MRSRIARAALLSAEAVGVLVAIAACIAAFVFWRVQSGPVTLNWAAPFIQSAANATVFNGSVRRIGSITLSRTEEGEGYRVDLHKVSLGRRNSEASALLPEVRLVFRPADLFSGKAGPRRLEIRGAELRIIRRADRRIKLDFGEAVGERTRVFQSLTGGAYFREAFERAELTDATLIFVDEVSRRSWTGKRGEAQIARTQGGYAARLSSLFDIGGRRAAISLESNYDLETEVISSRLALKDAPVAELVAVLFNENANFLTSPISGAATLDLGSDGSILSSRIDISAGQGQLAIGDWSTAIASFSASAAFDPRRNEFDLERAEWSAGIGEGRLAGVISLLADKNRTGVREVDFALVSDGLSVVEPTLFDAPLVLASAALSGKYAVGRKALDLEEFRAQLPDAAFSGRLSFSPQAGKSPAVSAAAKIDGDLDPASLLKIWPKGLALGARNFVSTRVPRATFNGVNFVLNLKPGAIDESGVMPDEAMALSFRAEGADVIYAPGMTPMTGVSGKGALRGNSFSFSGEKGSIAKVRITSANVNIPVIAPKGQPAYFHVSATGDAGDILAVLSQEPLAVLKETRYVASQFSGQASVSVEIERPNLRIAPRESYRYKGFARFSNLSVDEIIGEAGLSDGRGRLDLTTDGMTVKADAKVGEAPVSIDWRQRFYGRGDKTLIFIEGVADSSMADLFAVPTRQLIQGGVPFSATAVGGVNAFRTLELKADFTNVALMSETFGWLKPQGTPATGAAKFEFSPTETAISEISVDGDGVTINGRGAISPAGALVSLEVPVFRLAGAADLAFSAKRDDNYALNVTANGAYLNAAEIVRKLVDVGFGGTGAKAPVSFSAKVARVDLRGGASFRDASLRFARDIDRIDALLFKAIGEEGDPIAVELNDRSIDGAQSVAARAENVGEMLQGFFDIASVKDGKGRLDFTFTPGEEDTPREGALEARDLRIVKAPLLAKIFAAGSLTGLVDLMNGDGIELQNAIARFDIKDGAVRFREARAPRP